MTTISKLQISRKLMVEEQHDYVCVWANMTGGLYKVAASPHFLTRQNKHWQTCERPHRETLCLPFDVVQALIRLWSATKKKATEALPSSPQKPLFLCSSNLLWILQERASNPHSAYLSPSTAPSQAASPASTNVLLPHMHKPCDRAPSPW